MSEPVKRHYLPDNVRRTRITTFFAREDEKEFLQRLAQREGKTVSAILRAMIHNHAERIGEPLKSVEWCAVPDTATANVSERKA